MFRFGAVLQLKMDRPEELLASMKRTILIGYADFLSGATQAGTGFLVCDSLR